VEAAQIPWRPLGRLLVEQGLLTDDELELALAKQVQTGKRLGETIVECGFVSRPDLSNALASQYGIDLQTESGFGTGLRSQIQRRHENERGRGFRPALVVVSDPTEGAAAEDQEPAEVEPDEEREALLLAQLEEQWAKLAAAEAKLADRELALSNVERDRGRRRAQVERFVRRIRVRDERLRQSTEIAEKLRAQVEELSSQVRSRDERLEGLSEVEAELADRERELSDVTGDGVRRRAQVARFVGRVRVRDERLRRSQQDLDDLTEIAEKLLAQVEELSAQVRTRDEELERLREVEAGLAESERGAEERSAEIVRLTDDVRSRQEGLDDLTRVAERRLVQIEDLSGQVRSRDERIERLTGDVRGCDEEIERQRAELEELSTQVRSRDEQIERLTDDVRGCDEEIERLRAQVAPAPEPTVGHLVLVQLADRYELVARAGALPRCGAELELPELCDDVLVVAGSGRSPLPGDPRPCAFAQLGNARAVRSS
jgi:peptidoglycan hydrolase CwlO-like protein